MTRAAGAQKKKTKTLKFTCNANVPVTSDQGRHLACLSSTHFRPYFMPTKAAVAGARLARHQAAGGGVQ